MLICKPAEQKTDLGLEVVLLSFFCPLGRMGSADAAHHCLSLYVGTDKAVQTDGLQSIQISGLFQDVFILPSYREEIQQLYFWGKQQQNTGLMPHAQLHQIAPCGCMPGGQALGRLASLVVPVPTHGHPSPPHSPKPLWSLPNYDSSQLA